MTQEQKAKAYDEALKEAKEIVNDQNASSVWKGWLCNRFPELRKSEDEKVRKEIIDFIYDKTDTYELREKSNSWLAWLEKQRKEKPTNDVNPKFHEGEWIVSDKNNVVRIKSIDSNYYVLENTMRFTIDYVDKCWHLWTIENVKDGDVLAFKNNISGIIICKSPTDYDTGSYCRFVNDIFINREESGWDSTLLVPATKEQRDTLMKAMTDAGYTFDFENKEFKKIKQKAEENKGNIGGISPNWGEEDEKRIANILSVLSVQVCWDGATGKKMNPYQKEIDWLKSLRPQKWKPSEEQLKALHDIYESYRKYILRRARTITN